MKVGYPYWFLIRGQGRRQRHYYWGITDLNLRLGNTEDPNDFYLCPVGSIQGIWLITSQELYMLRYNIYNKLTITKEQYNQMYQQQKGLCAICGRKKRLSVDHKHGENVPRGLLCGNCNRGLGCFEDNIDLLGRAIDYITLSEVPLDFSA